MQQIWAGSPIPSPEDGSPADSASTIARHLDRPRRGRQGRPWILANMVSSVDGSVTLAGRSGGLAGDGDRALFRAIRAVADAILVGAGTVRAERYRPPKPATEGAEPPRLTIVSGRLDLDPELPCFRDAEPGRAPWILTGGDAPADRRAALADVAELIDVGPGRVHATAAVDELAARGARVVLCEGGPSLLGQLAEADLVDEWLLTVGAVVVGGEGDRVTRVPAELEQRLDLASAVTDGTDLFLAYVRAVDR